MEIIEEKSSKIFKSIIAILFLMLCITYFIFHLLNGKYSIFAFIQHKKTLVEKKEELVQIEKEYNIKRTKIERLKEDNLDLDLIDEELRKKLGHAKKNEIVIYDRDE